jgi:hypothetical protein
MESTVGLISKLATLGVAPVAPLAWYPSPSPDITDPESIGARGGRGSHFAHVRR